MHYQHKMCIFTSHVIPNFKDVIYCKLRKNFELRLLTPTTSQSVGIVHTLVNILVSNSEYRQTTSNTSKKTFNVKVEEIILLFSRIILGDTKKQNDSHYCEASYTVRILRFYLTTDKKSLFFTKYISSLNIDL